MMLKAVMAGLLFFTAINWTTTAEDQPGCEGLSEFRDQIMPIGLAWGQELVDSNLDPSRSPATFSSDDWSTYAEIALTYHRELKAVDAPEWLNNWLQVRLEATGLQEQIGKAAAESGMFVLLGFEQEVTDLDQRDEAAKAAAIERCPNFAQFSYDWDALDGEVDGTPVAVPTPTS